MFTRVYDALFLFLMQEYCLARENMVYVENIQRWCRENGIAENEPDRPIRLAGLASGGCMVLIAEQIPDDVMNSRMQALSVRNQLKNNLSDVADRLNSDKKRLAYLFLSEYASSLPEVGSDELLKDAWAIKEMERLNFFRE